VVQGYRDIGAGEVEKARLVEFKGPQSLFHGPGEGACVDFGGFEDELGAFWGEAFEEGAEEEVVRGAIEAGCVTKGLSAVLGTEIADDLDDFGWRSMLHDFFDSLRGAGVAYLIGKPKAGQEGSRGERGKGKHNVLITGHLWVGWREAGAAISECNKWGRG
jgi:hypothetical protein